MAHQAPTSMDCSIFQLALSDYVRRELARQPVVELYPEMMDHRERCPACERLYYREFRTQVLQKPPAEPHQVGERAAVAEQTIATPLPPQRLSGARVRLFILLTALLLVFFVPVAVAQFEPDNSMGVEAEQLTTRAET